MLSCSYTAALANVLSSFTWGGIILQKQEAAQEGKCCCCLDKTFSKTGDSTKALDAAT